MQLKYPQLNINTLNTPLNIYKLTVEQADSLTSFYDPVSVIKISDELSPNLFTLPTINNNDIINEIKLTMDENYAFINEQLNFLQNNLIITKNLQNKQAYLYNSFIIAIRKIPALKIAAYLLLASSLNLSKNLPSPTDIEDLLNNLPENLLNS